MCRARPWWTSWITMMQSAVCVRSSIPVDMAEQRLPCISLIGFSRVRLISARNPAMVDGWTEGRTRALEESPSFPSSW